jgi:hypothetical protein
MLPATRRPRLARPSCGVGLAVLTALALGAAVGCARDSRCLVVLKFTVKPEVGPLSRTVVNFPGFKPFEIQDLNKKDDVRDGLQLGFFVSGLTGMLDVQAFGYDSDNCIVAKGVAAKVPIEPGKVVNATIVLEVFLPRFCEAADGGSEAREAGADGTSMDVNEGSDGGMDLRSDAGADSQSDAGADTLDTSDVGSDRGTADTMDATPAADASEAPPADAGTGETRPFVSCKTYCDTLTPVCPNNAEAQGNCEELCALFFPRPPTTVDDPLACRIQYATPTMPPVLRCSAGGFNGGGLCGLGDSLHNWCDVYCQFAATVCDGFGLTPIQCEQACAPLSPQNAAGATGNNVACRIRQLVIAGGLAPDQRTTYCANASIMPTTGPCL